MNVQDGLYKIDFSTPLGEGAGVVVIKANRFQGGDSSMAYSGHLDEKGDDISATAKVFQHSEGESVLGVSDATLSLTGQISGDAIHLSGTASEAPGVTIKIRMTRLL